MALEDKNTIGQLRNGEFIKVILKSVVEDITSGVSCEEFQRTFTTLNGKAHIAKSLYKLQVEDITIEAQQNIDAMYNDTNIGEKYSELTKLINENNTANCKKIAWRPITGDYKHQMKAPKKKLLLEKKKLLENMLNETHSLYLLKKKTLKEKRQNIEKLIEQINNTNKIVN